MSDGVLIYGIIRPAIYALFEERNQQENWG
mgnify:CR=1 FL=1